MPKPLKLSKVIRDIGRREADRLVADRAVAERLAAAGVVPLVTPVPNESMLEEKGWLK
jgi:hypothetical protein